jgi:hypothetical protein
MSRFINFVHAFRLMAPIDNGVLNDAKKVDPNITNTKRYANINSVLECLGECGTINLLQKPLEIRRKKFKRHTITPVVTQGHIGCIRRDMGRIP